MKPLWSFLGGLGAMVAGVAATFVLATLSQALLPKWFFVIENGPSLHGLLEYARLFAMAFVLTGASGAVAALLSPARWPGPALGCGWMIVALLDPGVRGDVSAVSAIIVGTLLVAPMLVHAVVGGWRRRRKARKEGLELELE